MRILIIIFVHLLLIDAKRRSNRFLWHPNAWYSKHNLGTPSTLPSTTPYLQCDCGRPNDPSSTSTIDAIGTRIINGTAIKPHQYPWLVLILYLNNFICGGSIISDYYIATAGHCLESGFAKNDLKVLLGQHNNCESNSDTVTLSIQQLIRHPLFNKTSYAYDIMLIRVNMRITFNLFIRPICLPKLSYYAYQANAFDAYKGQIGTIVGWGTTQPNNQQSLSCLPLQVNVPILERRNCPRAASTLFCAGYLNGLADSCQGDSGGPIQLLNRRRSRYELIGIISSGDGCALPDNPGLYTDVLQLLNWIYKHMSTSQSSYPSDTTTCWSQYKFY